MVKNAEEMLEKRVRSRLSNMKVYLEVDYTFDCYVGMFRDFLTLPGNFGNRAYAKKWNSSVQVKGCLSRTSNQKIKSLTFFPG